MDIKDVAWSLIIFDKDLLEIIIAFCLVCRDFQFWGYEEFFEKNL